MSEQAISARLRAAASAVRAELRAGRPRRGEKRGVAMLIVLTTLAIVTAFTAEFHYKSYIRLHVASNLRDEVTAYYHARSAMEIARLVIKNQNVADNILGAFTQGTGRSQFVELWTFACEFANAFCTGNLKLMGRDFLDLSKMGGVGVEEGGFCKCRAQPEDGRININRVDNLTDKNQLFGELYSKFVAHRELELLPGEIDEETAKVALNIIDWADADENRSDLANGRVVESPQGEGGLGRDFPIKNAKFDTLAELQMVDDITPEMYCKIADELTPYATKKLNVNQAMLSTLRRAMCMDGNVTNAQESCFSVVPGLLPFSSVDYGLGCADICRSLRQALYSPGFSNVNQFFTVFDRMPATLGVQ